jgi:RNA 2',3'-cyclic 3'-phosphodiesterase
VVPDSAPRSLRLFVALELPADWRRALAQLQREQEQLAPGYFRWVQSELFHFTLVFLGSVPAAQQESVATAVSRAAAQVQAFALRLGRVGSFGPSCSPRVLWVDVEQDEPGLVRLRAALEQTLREAQISFDEKPLVPHITLGRGKRGSQRGVRLASIAPHASPFAAREIVLMESQLLPRGPSYFMRYRASLG